MDGRCGDFSFPGQLHGFAASRSGIAAVEFALLLPLLLILFFGVVEGSDAMSQSRRVSLAANTLADLAAQETELLTGDADDLFDGVEQIVGAGGGAVTIRLISVVPDPDGDPIVHWSRDNSGGAPYEAGAPYAGLPASALLTPDASIIVGEISFPYTSKLTQYFIPSVDFEDSATRWPRRALRVRLCTAPGNCV